jgi:hypothetical protein
LWLNWNRYPGFVFSDDDWFSEFYIATYTRASPYIFGILFGYFMYYNSDVHRTTGRKLPAVRLFVLSDRKWFCFKRQKRSTYV